MQRSAFRRQPEYDCLRRHRAGIEDPCLREDLAKALVRLAAHLVAPQLLERRVVKQRERELLFEKRLRGRGHFDTLVARGIEEELLLGNIEQVEQLEEAVEQIDFAPAARRVDDERLLGEDD